MQTYLNLSSDKWGLGLEVGRWKTVIEGHGHGAFHNLNDIKCEMLLTHNAMFLVAIDHVNTIVMIRHMLRHIVTLHH